MMTPTLGQEAIEFFRTREDETHSTYIHFIYDVVDDTTIEAWTTARDLRHEWQLAYADWKRAVVATPCTHRLAERAHEAQRCDWCWMLSTYSRLSTPKENEDVE